MPRHQVSLIRLLYATGLLGVSLAAFGPFGGIFAVLILATWYLVLARRSWYSAFLASGCACLLMFSALFSLMLAKAVSLRPPPSYLGCAINLEHLSRAIRKYEADHGGPPPARVVDDEGNPMHSWRVLLLPYLHEKALYKKYNFDEPWDGPSNQRLLTQMPEVYRCPSVPTDGHDRYTSYVAVLEAGSPWRDGHSRSQSNLRAGGRDTLLLAETEHLRIPWTKPYDPTVDEFAHLLSADDITIHDRITNFGSYHGWHAVFASGRVEYLDRGASADYLRSVITPSSQEAAPSEPIAKYAPNWGRIFRWLAAILFTLMPFISFLLPRGSQQPMTPNEAS